MTNPLTGEFDVAGHVSVVALNRVLAAQHQISGDHQMYFHSVRINLPAEEDQGVSGAVDVQVSPPSVSLPPRAGPPVVVASAAGIATTALLPAALAPTLVHTGPTTPPWLPSPGGDSRMTIHFQVRARFRPDGHSVDAPEFVHGEVRATVNAEQVISISANVISVDLGASDVQVDFVPAAGAPLSPTAASLVESVVDRMMRRGFEPVNHVISLPTATDGFAPHHWRFKTMPYPTTPGVAVLFNMTHDRVPTDAARDAFDSNALEAGDDFALAAGAEFLIPTLRDLIRREIDDQVLGATERIKRKIFRLTVIDVTYEVTSAGEPIVDFHPDAVRLSVSVTADGTGFPSPRIEVTLTQDFTATTVSGAIRLQRVGDVGVSVDIGGGIAGWIVSLFKGRIKNMISEKANGTLDIVVNQAGPVLDEMLGGLGSLAGKLRIPDPELLYRTIEISRDGLIVRGDLRIKNWDPVVVSFTSRTRPGSQLELDAYDSWIPGGTIESFQWRFGDGTAVHQVIDHEHQFIARPPSAGPVLVLWSQWCLEVRGRQDTGPISASNCGLIGSPVVVATDDDGVGSTLPIAVLDDAGRLSAHVDLSGPPRDGPESPAPIWPANVLVYFSGRDPQGTSDLVRGALREAQLDGELLVVSVLQPGALHRSRLAEGSDLPGAAIVYAEDFDGIWTRAFDGGPGAACLLNTRTGIAWRSDNHPTTHDLAAALSTHAVAAPLPPRSNLRLAVSEGDRAPDFLFDFGADTAIALRSLRGRPALLTFFKSWSKPCRDELARIQTGYARLSAAGWLVLAVGDGEGVAATSDMAESLALKYRVLADPERRIARKYGVHAWPTTVAIDAAGMIQQVLIGVAPDTPAKKYS